MIRRISALVAGLIAATVMVASPASADKQHDVRGFDRPGCKASSYSAHTHRKHEHLVVKVKSRTYICKPVQPAPAARWIDWD